MTKALTLVFLCCWFCGYGQTPDWVWARSAQSGVNGVGEVISIATDKSNNVYITGWYGDTLTFGSINLRSNLESPYLAKYDSSGNIRWAISPIVDSIAIGQSVCTDILSNCYLTGSFRGHIYFGADTLTSVSHGWDIFIVKYDSSGNLLWAKSKGGTGIDESNAIASDDSGNVFITGNFSSSSFILGTDTLSNPGDIDIFICKFDSSGNVLWARSAGGISNDEGYGIAVDDSANAYITGKFDSPTLTFGSYALTNSNPFSADVFLAKYSASGNVSWAKSTGGPGYEEGLSVAVDESQSVYLTGYYSSDSIRIGPYTLPSSGADDVFFVKYDSSGNVRWAKSIGGTGNELGRCVTIDKSYRIYISGSFEDSLLTFDTITVHRPSVYLVPMFIAEYDSSGHAQWAQALGSGGGYFSDLSAGTSGCVYIGGSFQQINPFIIGNDSLYLSGNVNVFVAKLCANSSQGIIIESNPNEFLIYPNPAKDEIVVSFEGFLPFVSDDFKIEIFNVMGEKVYTRQRQTPNAKHQTTVDVSALPDGIYFLKISSEMLETVNRKFVVMH